MTLDSFVALLSDTAWKLVPDLQKLEKPLQTVNELSETVDLVHEASRNAVRSALVTIIENASSIKDWIFSKKKEESQTEGIVAEEDAHEQK